MRRIGLSFLWLLFANFCSAQNLLGIQAGVGMCTAHLSAPIIPTPQFEGYFLRTLSTHFAVGIAAGIDRYSFVQTNAQPGNTTYEGVLSIKQQSTYLCLSPKADFAIGKRRTIHAMISFGVDKLLVGAQSSDINYRDTHYGSYAGYYTRLVNFEYTSTPDISKTVFVAKAGFTERVAHENRYSIFLFQEFSYLPGYLSKYEEQPLYAIYVYRYANQFFLKNNYFSCGICITSEYGKRNKPILGKKTAHRHIPDGE